VTGNIISSDSIAYPLLYQTKTDGVKYQFRYILKAKLAQCLAFANMKLANRI